METISDPLLRDDIQRCVAGDPQKRFAGAAQLATRLRTLNTRRAAHEEEKARIAALERRAYRRGLIRAGLAACAILILIATLALRAHWAAREARAALAMSYVTRAEESDQKGNGAAALAFLASATELDPDSAAAADRLWFILTQRFWPRPLGVPMQGESVTSVHRVQSRRTPRSQLDRPRHRPALGHWQFARDRRSRASSEDRLLGLI